MTREITPDASSAPLTTPAIKSWRGWPSLSEKPNSPADPSTGASNRQTVPEGGSTVDGGAPTDTVGVGIGAGWTRAGR